MCLMCCCCCCSPHPQSEPAGQRRRINRAGAGQRVIVFQFNPAMLNTMHTKPGSCGALRYWYRIHMWIYILQCRALLLYFLLSKYNIEEKQQQRQRGAQWSIIQGNTKACEHQAKKTKPGEAYNMMNIACNLRKEWRKKIGRRRRRAWLASWNGDYKIQRQAASVCSAGPCLFVRQKDKQLSRELANKTGFAPAAHTRFFPVCARRQKKAAKRFFFLGASLNSLMFYGPDY